MEMDLRSQNTVSNDVRTGSQLISDVMIAEKGIIAMSDQSLLTVDITKCCVTGSVDTVNPLAVMISYSIEICIKFAPVFLL